MRRCCEPRCGGWTRRCRGQFRQAFHRLRPMACSERAELTAHVVTEGGEISGSQLTGSVDDAPIAGNIRLQTRRAAIHQDRSHLGPSGTGSLATCSSTQSGGSVASGVRRRCRIALQCPAGHMRRFNDQWTFDRCDDRGRQHPAAPDRGYGVRRARRRVRHAWRGWQAERRPAYLGDWRYRTAGGPVAEFLAGDARLLAWSSRPGGAGGWTAGSAFRRREAGFVRCTTGG